MENSLYHQLWRRECGEFSPHTGIRRLYGSKNWIDGLDIVNELGGHTGCVNALSWSRSGQLLASGSDDTHLNIYSYQPGSSTAPFALNTTVFTGHTANIFSVKFMPHSNDRTLVTSAGDSQVRVFDIEYSINSAKVGGTSASRASARSQRLNNFFAGAQYLSEASTNARVYRSHGDRVKRIVTESSPYLFLTCSEDGEVRQWDLRQPSEAYPPPRGGQGFMNYRPGIDHDDTNVPPPLISYKRYHVDLNTISCSPSQPHYIALGGAHLHCFLHDRRMLGRDLLAERGEPDGTPPPLVGSRADELMGEATRCVRRFAPDGKRRMHGRRDAHITACKISDANPNEMIVSWSGDHIYSFNLVQSHDARDARASGRASEGGTQSRKARSSKSRKRKRQKGASRSSAESHRGPHQAPRLTDEPDGAEDLAFRVRYGNGESEDIPIPRPLPHERSPPVAGNLIQSARTAVLSEAQLLSERIAKSLVKLRKALFSLDALLRDNTAAPTEDSDLTPYAASFSSAMTLAATCLPQMTDVMRNWRYPMNPAEETVRVQQTLRRHRESAWRFVQAAGTVSRMLGGTVQEGEAGEIGDTDSDVFDSFQQIEPAPGENDTIDDKSQFGYDFLKAIVLWLEGGRPALLEGFRSGSSHRRRGHRSKRYPLGDHDQADDGAIETTLIPYLQALADDSPVVNVDASRFEHDETRIVFPTQHAAVTAFANVIKLPLEDLGNAAARTEASSSDHGAGPGAGAGASTTVRALDRNAAKRFWVMKVGRGILMETGSEVNFQFVYRAFGGLRVVVQADSDDEDVSERIQEDIDPEVDEAQISAINVVVSHVSRPIGEEDLDGRHDAGSRGSSDDQDGDIELHDEYDEDEDEDADMNMDVDSSSSEDLDEEDDEDDDDDFDEDEPEEAFLRRYRIRRTRREDVQLQVPCSSHTRVYTGHCNIKTIKDVNFFGLNDEYVVSGCDSGNLFIWDRKTAKLVNILSGDREVVNVVQGHPYEPTLAVSGIDKTIKIFSPDRRAQSDARRGINILDPDHPANARAGAAALVGGLPSRKRIQKSYQIMSQNDVDREGGMSEAYITRSMLARLAAALRDRNGDQPVTLEENCVVM